MSNYLSGLLNVTVLDCPPGFIFETKGSVKTCVINSMSVIMPIVIVTCIVTFLLGIGLGVLILYGLIILVKKLTKLRRHERAEQDIERKLTDKSFVFEANIPLLESSHSEKEEQPSYVIPIDEITILKRIGEGSNGVVYHAKWNHTDVAIKKLKMMEEEVSVEFEREATMLSSLRHPSIVNFYGVSLTSNGNYMVVSTCCMV